MGDGERLALRQEMTLTRDEFLRALPAAVDGVAYTVDGDTIRSLAAGARWRIALTPLPELRLGMIRLARHRVEIFVEACDATTERALLERFELYFRRGGG